MGPQYVFIVGLPRTGTKLTMNVLARGQKKCHILHENFFLGRVFRPGVRQKMRRMGDMAIDANVRRLVDAMYSAKFHGVFWRRLARGRSAVTKETMLERILSSDRSDRAIYEMLLQVTAENVDDAILGDKSGPNLYRVPTLLDWFPDAKIIHTFRDPRAILSSELKVRRRLAKSASNLNPSQVFLKLIDPVLFVAVVSYITIAWLNAVRLHHEYRRLYPENYYLSKFEDLVSEPEENVQRLCEFVGIEFDSEMLNPPHVDSSYALGGNGGFVKHTLTKWQSELAPWLKAWVLFWARRRLREFGYV